MSDAAIYVRVSTEEQGDRNLSLPAQLDACRRFAEERGWQVVREYQDVGSAKSDRREAFQSLVADAASGRFQAVIVFKYSRFARNDLDSQLYEAELNRRGVVLVSATEPVDGDTSAGWLSKRIMQVLAEFENRQKADFVRAGMRQLLEQGGWPWRAPLGYVNRQQHLDAKHVRKWVEPDPKQAPLVRQAFELYATGEYALQALADELERRGLRTRDGNPLSAQIVLNLLTNEFYAGVVSSAAFSIRAQGQHGSLISRELFDRVQAVVTIRNKGVKRSRRHRQLLRGLAWCACGQRMTIDTPKQGRYAYLRCMSHVNKRRDGCRRQGPPVADILSQLEEKVLPSLYVAPDDVEAVRDDLLALSLAGEEHAQEELDSLRLRLAHERKRAEALLNLRLDGELAQEEYRRKKADLERSIALMVARQTELEERRRHRTASVDMVVRVANSLPVLWAKGSEVDRRELLELVFEKLVVADGRIVRPVLREPFRLLEARKGPVPEVFRGTSAPLAATEEVASREG